MHENWGKSIVCPMYKKLISPPFEWFIAKYPGLCTVFIKTSNCNLMFMVYHAETIYILGH